jgi:hypothetical protein
MAKHWILRDSLSLGRSLRLRWLTRNGFDVSDSPAFDPETTDWFKNRLNSLSHYVEYGSGASTILAARKDIRTISMESDPYYAKAVRAALPKDAPVKILDADLGMTENWGYPVATRRTAERLESWLNYAMRPLTEAVSQGWLPELALVDGRFRCACALASAQAAQRSGSDMEVLFDDYDGRPYYQWVESHLGEPQMIGRAALFRVEGTSSQKSTQITDAVVAAAAQDFR